MPDVEAAQQVLTTAVGAGTGAGVMLWFAKQSWNRLIAQYDKKHDAHDAALAATNAKSTELLVKLTTVETHVEIMRDITMKLGGVNNQLERLGGDLNNVGNKLRKELEAISDRFEKTEEETERLYDMVRRKKAHNEDEE